MMWEIARRGTWVYPNHVICSPSLKVGSFSATELDSEGKLLCYREKWQSEQQFALVEVSSLFSASLHTPIFWIALQNFITKTCVCRNAQQKTSGTQPLKSELSMDRSPRRVMPPETQRGAPGRLIQSQQQDRWRSVFACCLGGWQQCGHCSYPKTVIPFPKYSGELLVRKLRA